MRLSRPRLIGLAAGVAIFAVVVLVQALGGNGGDDPPAAQATSTPSASARETATPAQTSTTTDAPLSGPIDDGFVRSDLAPDEIPDRSDGIVLVDVGSGESEFWRGESARENQANLYEVDTGHRWLQWTDYAEGRWVIGDRASEQSYEIDPSVWTHAAGPTESGVLVLRRRQGGRYVVVDLARNPTTIRLEFRLPLEASPSAPPSLATASAC